MSNRCSTIRCNPKLFKEAQKIAQKIFKRGLKWFQEEKINIVQNMFKFNGNLKMFKILFAQKLNSFKMFN
jgi:hypothetical protein